MSNKALNWAWEQRIPSTRKMVLLRIADSANDSRNQAWELTQDWIAERTGYTDRCVRASLVDLERWGLITVEKRPGSWDLYRCNLAVFCQEIPKRTPEPRSAPTPEPDSTHPGTRRQAPRNGAAAAPITNPGTQLTQGATRPTQAGRAQGCDAGTPRTANSNLCRGCGEEVALMRSGSKRLGAKCWEAHQAARRVAQAAGVA